MECFLTGDGKGMKAANFLKGKWCWLCSDVNVLRPLPTVDECVRYGLRAVQKPNRHTESSFLDQGQTELDSWSTLDFSYNNTGDRAIGEGTP